MKLVKPSFEVKRIDPEILEIIEDFGRTSYKSEDKITPGSAKKFVKMIIKRNHGSVLEAYDITVKFFANRGFSHELVRHRIASYNQESTRYCNYSKYKFDNQVTFCDPDYFELDYLQNKLGLSKINAWQVVKIWVTTIGLLEERYLELLHLGIPAQLARDILPIGLKTEINIKTNIREWREILKQRTAQDAHPIMQELMGKLLKYFQENIPVLFDDI